MAEDVLLDTTARERGYFNPAVVSRLLDEHVRGVARWHSQLWNLLMLELWHRTFIDRRPDADPVRHPLVEIGRTRRDGALAGSVAPSVASRDSGLDAR
jgi:hypothetical protein